MIKRLLLGLMLLMTATTASAEWVKVGVSDKYNNVYFDIATLSRDGNLAELSSLLDYAVTQDQGGNAFRSLDTRFQFDCKRKHWVRVLYDSKHSDAMGGGLVVARRTSKSKWSSFPPDSNSNMGILEKVACGMPAVINTRSVLADLVQVGDVENVQIYVDRATIRKMGDMATMRQLYDYKTAHRASDSEEPYLSLNTDDEYDCKRKRMRMLYYTMYSSNKGEGKMVFLGFAPDIKWKLIAPESTSELIWEIACNKLKRK